MGMSLQNGGICLCSNTAGKVLREKFKQALPHDNLPSPLKKSNHRSIELRDAGGNKSPIS